MEDVRRLESATSNDARFEAIAAMLRSRSIPFSPEPFAIDKGGGAESRAEGRNIVVSFGQRAEQLVIGTHYDAARLPDGSLSRGAVDNGASSVILVRLAEALRSESLSMTVRLVWFDMEELGLLGSARYLKAHATDRIAAMLNFDINASGDTILFGPARDGKNAALRRLLMETCGAQDIPCVGFPAMPPGDDRSFVAAGIPTVSIAILPGVEAHQLWLMMNAGPSSGLAPGTVPGILRTIHTAGDTSEKVDGPSMEKVLDFALALVRKLARR